MKILMAAGHRYPARTGAMASDRVADWLAKKPELGKLLAAQPQVQALCPPGSVEALFQRLDKRNGFAAWTLLFYAPWHHRHIQNRPTKGGVFDVLSQRG